MTDDSRVPGAAAFCPLRTLPPDRRKRMERSISMQWKNPNELLAMKHVDPVPGPRGMLARNDAVSEKNHSTP